MSTPTRIYLFFVAIALLCWLAISNLGTPSQRPVSLFGDPEFPGRSTRDFAGALLGQVRLETAGVPDADGLVRGGVPFEIPPGALFVAVRAKNIRNGTTVIYNREVDPSGAFEVRLLPEGTADVTLMLGTGDVIHEVKDVKIQKRQVLDPRLNPIDMTGVLMPFSLRVLDATGERAQTGAIAWRPSGGATDDVTFGGVVPITDGRADFLVLAPYVDAISLVPGAAVELFDTVQSGQELRLGPGTVLRLVLEGEVPDPTKWIVRPFLHPIELSPALDFGHHSFGSGGDLRPGEEALAAEVAEDPDTGTVCAKIPVVRGGRYELRWNAEAVGVSRRRHATYSLSGGRQEIVLPTSGGEVDVTCAFPAREFAGKTAEQR